MTYTINTCVNPSVELSLDGYASDATMTQDFSVSYVGSASVKVVTSGMASQSIQTPSYVYSDIFSQTWTASLYILGEGAGSVDVTLFTTAGTTTKTVFLTASWQRVTFTGIAIAPGAGNQVFLSAAATGSLTFWIDAVQYEQNTSATEYCDGDQYGCTWLGAPHASASSREVEFAASSEGSENSDGSLSIIVSGEAFPDAALGEDTTEGDLSFVHTNTTSPVAAFDDFAQYPAGTQDPALSYVRYSNAGEVTGEYGRSWIRNYALFIPPLDYPNSTGLSWKRAAYAAVGFRFANLTGTNYQYLDTVQLEKFHINTVATSYSAGHRYDPDDVVSQNSHYYRNLATSTGVAPPASATSNGTWAYIGEIWGPSEYVTPRQLHTTIKPTVMNFIQNPSFEVSTNYWFNVGDTTITRVNTATPPFGTWAMRARNNTLDPGQKVYIDVEQLIVGRTYVASAYFKVTDDIYDVIIGAGIESNSVQGGGVPYGGDETANPPYRYGDGPYGGIVPPGPVNGLDNTLWYRVATEFVATSYTMRVSITPSFTSDAVFPVDFFMDGVMVEEGGNVSKYVDGAQGFDYLWETDGIAGEARSYYYEGRRVKTYTVEDTITESTPIGITAADPVYAKPYTQ